MLKEFGADLKALRESRGITIAEIASETRINPKFLLNFEAGVFDFQPDIYVRAFLKEYGSILGIDPMDLLGDYERAKSGYYNRKFYQPFEQEKEQIGFTDEPEIQDAEKYTIRVKDESDIPKETVEEIPEEKTKKPFLRKTSYEESEISQNKGIYQKIFLGFLIIGILVGMYFIYDYFVKTSEPSSDVKPKSFDEISADFENKINRRGDKEIEDSIAKAKEQQMMQNMNTGDSLTLTIRVARDTRIKVYLDGDVATVEGIIAANDSVNIKAKDNFRFSASNNQLVDLSLNGKRLDRTNIPPGPSIKNLIINKTGIIKQ